MNQPELLTLFLGMRDDVAPGKRGIAKNDLKYASFRPEAVIIPTEEFFEDIEYVVDGQSYGDKVPKIAFQKGAVFEVRATNTCDKEQPLKAGWRGRGHL